MLVAVCNSHNRKSKCKVLVKKSGAMYMIPKYSIIPKVNYSTTSNYYKMQGSQTMILQSLMFITKTFRT